MRSEPWRAARAERSPWLARACVVLALVAAVRAQGPRYLETHAIGAAVTIPRGCHSITSTAAVNMADASDATCSGTSCASCFRIHSTSAAIELTITNCSYDMHGNNLGTTAVRPYTFINTGTVMAFVGDGTRRYALAASGHFGAATDCYCFNGDLACGAAAPEVALRRTQAVASITEAGRCASVTADADLDMATYGCGSGKACPQCYSLATSSPITLTIRNCHTYHGVGVGSDYIVTYFFMVTGPSVGKVSDGTNKYTLSPRAVGGSSTTCHCYNGEFSCDAATVGAHGSTFGTYDVPEALSVAQQAALGSPLLVRGVVRFAPAMLPLGPA